ncbi:MAG: hybrid sensor histidine kinase/response regulator [Sulfuricurvum sp.]|uniref:hybrid sensor histidine kinase/response regulator n=1 Tax=Sulfuricurvum sp. TaxID=2025608 RepID=UPI0025D8B8BA|nr:hybrid sensor histidine kinase/response regulator [Sulfuricurvum sp.]MBV5321131.1 hybrid sensor histidine kinase/response regulator [Sulfuricurvum sp.]
MSNAITELKKLSYEKNLLIVEDDLNVLESLERLLSHFFTHIFTASTFGEALENYTRMQSMPFPFIIISDIHLGQENGIDLIRLLKQYDANQKVIAISGTEDRDIFIESIRYGVDRFVLKPIDQRELFNALTTLLQRINYDLELEASQKLLEDSKEYALKLLEEQDQFLKNAIHEIHTPLSVIITNIDLLRIDGIDNEYLNAIEAGSRIIQNSYEDMTYLMKRDRVPDYLTTLDMVEFIHERVRYFTCIAEVNELSMSIRVGQPNLPLIHFNVLKLSRLVDNTLSNAIKYSYRPSEINVTVGIRKGDLFFEVRNHGPLIQDKKKIFQRFYRESEHKGGYGLGLSIVAQICKEENIEIELSSTAVRGTAFRYIFKNATLLQHNSSTMPLLIQNGVNE